MTDDPGSMKPLTDALVGGLISFLCITTPIIAVVTERPTPSITLCQTTLSCIANQDVGTAPA